MSIATVFGRVLPDKMRVRILYRCVKCQAEAVLDPYDGVPCCKTGHDVAWMEPLELMRTHD